MPSTRIKTLSRISSYNVDVINANSVTVLGASVVGGAGIDAYARTTANNLQGALNTANTRITVNENVDAWQNSQITAVQTLANTDYTTITVTSGVYGNATFVPVITLGANGRVIAVTNTAISSGGGGGATITDDTTSSGTRYITMTTQTSGSQSIANTSTTKLYFQPSTGTLSSTIFSSLSDETKKTNINVISNSLNVTENIRGVTFDWTDGTGSSAGLIAQDVEKYLPQLIHIDENGTKALNYNGVIGVLVEAVKELSERVKQLESK